MSEEITKQNNYSASDIEVLEGLEGVRKRPAMYIGSSNGTGLHHLLWEVVDNGVDEALSGYGNKITVTIHKDGSISVSDEGRGIPCGIQKKYNIPAVQLIFTTLHSGGKFSDKVYSSSAGLHGVGASVANALSEWLDVVVCTSGKKYHISFKDGGKLNQPLEILENTKKTGTTVTFKPDPKIFSTVDFKYDTITSHLQESAFLLKNVRFVIKDERTNSQQEYFYTNGVKEYVQTLNAKKSVMGSVIYLENSGESIAIECAFQWCSQDYNESIYSYANNVRTKDGGTHETGFRSGLTKAVNDFADRNSLLRGKNKLEGNDIREGLTAVISLRIPESILEYEGQTKGKLGTPEANSIVNNFVYTKVSYYLDEHKEFAVTLIKKCIDSQNARVAARKAKEDARKTKKNKSEIMVSDKLTPAQSRDYKNNELFIVEGESAGGTARKGRNRLHQAILPLRGKPLNTDSVTLERMLKNEEFGTIISTIGADVGPNFNLDDSKYGKVIIMTDADTDGAHIQTLLLTFFYNYMRPLILAGKVFVAVPPLYRVYKEKKYIYAWNDNDLLEAKQKIGYGYKIGRYKGLGEMDADQLWETTMDPKSRLLIQVSIDDPLAVEKRVSILMGNDASLRRKWVEENVDFTVVDNFIKEVK